MELLKPILLLIHVLFAFAYVAGYVATNVLTELARRTDDPAFRRSALQFSTRFDRMLNAPGGTLVGLTGIATALVFGYSFLSGWVLASVGRSIAPPPPATTRPWCASCVARATWRSAASRTSRYSPSSC